MSGRAPFSSLGWIRRFSFLLLLILAACATPTPLPPDPLPTPAVYLTVACIPGARPHLDGWIAIYRRGHPGVVLETRPDTPARSQELLSRGDVAIALLDQPPFPHYRGVLTATQVAVEPLAAVVSRQNPLSSLSTAALVEVLAGRVANWQTIGGPAGPLTLYLLPDSAGEVRYLRDEVLAGRRLSPQAVVCASAASLLRAVAADPGGIGFLSAGAVGGEVAVLRVDGLLPAEDGYPWQMPLFLVYGPASPPQALDFVHYVEGLP